MKWYASGRQRTVEIAGRRQSVQAINDGHNGNNVVAYVVLGRGQNGPGARNVRLIVNAPVMYDNIIRLQNAGNKLASVIRDARLAIATEVSTHNAMDRLMAILRDRDVLDTWNDAVVQDILAHPEPEPPTPSTTIGDNVPAECNWLGAVQIDGVYDGLASRSRVEAQAWVLDHLCISGVVCLHGIGAEELSSKAFASVVNDALATDTKARMTVKWAVTGGWVWNNGPA